MKQTCLFFYLHINHAFFQAVKIGSYIKKKGGNSVRKVIRVHEDDLYYTLYDNYSDIAVARILKIKREDNVQEEAKMLKQITGAYTRYINELRRRRGG